MDQETLNREKKDLELFLSEGSDATTDDVRSKTLLGTAQKIKKSLVNSRVKLISVYSLGSIFGYVASLAFCEQNAVGIGRFSEWTSAAMCALGTPWCWLMCGVIFSIFPIVTIRILLSRFEQRYVYKHLWPLVVLAPVVAATLMLVLPKLYGVHESSNAMEMMMLRSPQSIVWWIAGAILTPYLVEYLISLMLKQKTWSELSNK